MPERHLANRERETRSDVGKRAHGRTLQLRQLAKLNDEYPVCALREDGLSGAPCPLLMSGQLRQRLRPVAHDFIWPGEIPAAFLSGHGRES